MGRIISYDEKTGYNDGDYLLIDNSEGGTKRIQADRVGIQLDPTLTNPNKAAPANAVKPVDATPTQGSTNAVSSGGVYEALHNTDTTLSQSGQAADAKVTGDKITELKEGLNLIVKRFTNMLDPTNTESGTITSTGEKVDNASYHRNVNYIPVLPSTKYSTKNLTVVAEYTSDKTFIQRPYVSETTVFTTPNNCYYILAAGSADVSTWRMNKGETVDDTPYGQVSVNTNLDYTDVFKTTSIPYIIQHGFESGFVSLNGGVIGDSPKRARSVLIDIVQDTFNSYLVFSCNVNPPTYTYTVCALYKDGVFVKNLPTAYSSTQTAVALDGTFNQFRVCFKKANDTDFTAEEIASFAVSMTINIALSTVKGDVDSNSNRIAVLEDHDHYDTLNFVGKKYCALGDSITYGFAPRNCDEYGTRIDSYAKLTAEKLGMTFENYGMVGSTLAYHETRNPMSVRYTEMSNDADLITVMGGTNDIRNGIQLGTFADRTNTTYYGALHVLLGGLYKKYFIDQGVTIGKTKKVVVCTPIKLLDSSASELGGTGTLVDMSAWVEAVKEVSAYYSFPVLDFYNVSGINPHLNEIIQGTETGYTGVYNPYITDGTHPTKEGQQMMADVLCGFLKSLK